MSSTLRSAGGKGSLYTDASYRTAAIRKNAILKGQIQKGADVLSSPNALKKPLISEHHLQKGFTAGATEVILGKNKNGFI